MDQAENLRKIMQQKEEQAKEAANIKNKLTVEN